MTWRQWYVADVGFKLRLKSSIYLLLYLPSTMLLRVGKQDASRIPKAAGREVRSIKSSVAIL